MITSSTRLGSMPALSIAARAAITPRSTALKVLSAPRSLPTGVLAPDIMNASDMCPLAILLVFYCKQFQATQFYHKRPQPKNRLRQLPNRVPIAHDCQSRKAMIDSEHC